MRKTRKDKGSRVKHALLTDLQRKQMGSESLDRVSKDKLVRVLAQILAERDSESNYLAKDLNAILFSSHMRLFNLRNYGKWRQIRDFIEGGVAELERVRGEVSFNCPMLNVTIKNGRTSYYVAKIKSVTWYEIPEILSGYGFTDAEPPMAKIDPFEEIEIDQKTGNIKTEKLKVSLSLMQIPTKSRYVRDILKRAILLNYHFPTDPDKAVSLTEIKEGVIEVENKKESPATLPERFVDL